MTDHIDPKTQEYYENYLDLFAHPGWIQFLEDLEQGLEQDQKSAASRCDTSEKWFQERGRQAERTNILGFPAMLRAQYESLTNPQEIPEDLYE